MRGTFCLIEIRQTQAVTEFVGNGAEAIRSTSYLIVDDTIGIDDDPILLVGFPGLVLRQCPLVWPDGLISVFSRSVVLSVAGIYHDHLLHLAFAIPVVVAEVHLSLKSQTALDDERVGMLVFIIHILAVILPFSLGCERTSHIEIHIDDAVALVEEILVERTDGIRIGYFARVERVVPIRLRVGIEKRLVGILHWNHEL